jgi:hypothetical protein
MGGQDTRPAAAEKSVGLEWMLTVFRYGAGMISAPAPRFSITIYAGAQESAPRIFRDRVSQTG